MAKPFKKPHLTVSKFHAPYNYKHPNPGGGPPKLKKRDKKKQGNKILGKLKEIESLFEADLTIAKETALLKEDVVYVDFISEWGFDLNFKQLHTDANLKYKLVNVKKEVHPDNENVFRYIALVVLRKDGIAHFIDRVNKYLTTNTKNRKGEFTNTPVANSLVANIDDIKLATLEAFWVDAPQYKFPDPDVLIWWEVWFRKTEDDNDKTVTQLTEAGIDFSPTKLEFGEVVVRMVKATAKQLADSLMLLDNLSELRRPQEMNDFITGKGVEYNDKREWLEDLKARTNIKVNESSVLVCLLDTGVNNNHALLNDILPDNQLYTYNPAWGTDDTEDRGGHGTAMAALVLYGDLTDAIPQNGNIDIHHGIESYKVKTPDFSEAENVKPIFGNIYKAACASPVIDRRNPRVYCLTVTNNGLAYYGRPSAHSAALDQIAFGNSKETELIIVSGGTLDHNKVVEYPRENFLGSIHDPAQAYNVITVGSYTCKDKLTGGRENPITPYGGMSPNNSTSATWENQWPNKPDIVLEGGNLASDGTIMWQRDELKPLSIDKEYPRYLFLPFDGTCSASAFAAKFAAELRTRYPNFWPETIRGLMIHSADWTPAMIAGKDFSSQGDKQALIRSVGYGVPNLEKALYSGNNSLTLIAENSITPYKKEKSVIKYNEYHLYKLPWPKDVLEKEIGEKDARVTVTLSYFIDPNPGERRYVNDFSYHSHELDFNLIKPSESLPEFERRISSATAKENEDKPDLKSENWFLRERIRSKGSVKKDYLDTTGIGLARRYYLAVYPKNGWYKTRKALEMYDETVRYSLIVSIETRKTDVDIYTSIENLILAPISITV